MQGDRLLFGFDVHAQAVPMRSVKVLRCVWGGAQRLIVGVAVGMILGRATVRFSACVSVCVTQ